LGLKKLKRKIKKKNTIPFKGYISHVEGKHVDGLRDGLINLND